MHNLSANNAPSNEIQDCNAGNTCLYLVFVVFDLFS